MTRTDKAGVKIREWHVVKEAKWLQCGRKSPWRIISEVGANGPLLHQSVASLRFLTHSNTKSAARLHLGESASATKTGQRAARLVSWFLFVFADKQVDWPLMTSRQTLCFQLKYQSPSHLTGLWAPRPSAVQHLFPSPPLTVRQSSEASQHSHSCLKAVSL